MAEVIRCDLMIKSLSSLYEILYSNHIAVYVLKIIIYGRCYPKKNCIWLEACTLTSINLFVGKILW